MSKKTTSSNWGPYAWTLLHVCSLLCVKKNDTYLIARTKSFIKQSWKILPCAKCRADASRYLEKHDIMYQNNPEKIFEYTFEFHNNVNKKLKKKLFTKQQYQEAYNTVTDEHIERINQFTKYIKEKGSGSGISSFNIKQYLGFLRLLHSYCKLFKLRL